MRVLGLDIESTGLDPKNDHVTELAWVVKDVGDPKPLVLRSYFILPPLGMWDSTDYIKPTVEKLTKIKMSHLLTGLPFPAVFGELARDAEKHNVDYIVAQNGNLFDKPFLERKAAENSMGDACRVFDMPWLDTSTDVVYPDDCRYTNLTYLAAYHGFVSPFPHAALFDVMTMLRVLEHYDVAEVAKRAASPWLVVKADVNYDNRQLAKERRYSWETVADKTFPKSWVKRIKELDHEKEVAEAPFKVVRIA
jgi:DNA polymerase III epsilon subunit-like protein